MFSNVFSQEDIEYILQLPEVITAKDKLSNTDKVQFSITVTPSIRQAIKDRLGLDLTSEIPMRWIKGDTPKHTDRASKEFKNTYLVYLNDSAGEFILEGASYPITANTGYVFNEGVSHETQNTVGPRLLVGPMSELAEPVGAETSYIRYFNNYTDALGQNVGDEIARNADSYEVGNIASGNIGTITKWRVASVTYDPGTPVTVPTGVFINDDELSPPPGSIDVVYYLYPTVTPPYIRYFNNYSDANTKNISNQIAAGNSYVVGTNIVVGGDITPYTNWQVATTDSDPEFVITITTGVFANNFDMATLLAVGDPNTTVFYVYPASYIRYFNNYSDALSGNPSVEIARNADTYIVGAVVYGDISTITKWRVASVNFNPSDPVVIPTGVFNNGDDMTALALPGSDAIFYLYPTLTPPYIRYFDADAFSNPSEIAVGNSYILGTNIVGDIGSYTSWQVAGTQSDPAFVISPTPTGVFNNNDDMTTELVAGDPNTTVFFVYPEAPSYIRYFNNYTDAFGQNAGDEIARNADSYIVGNTASGNIGTITKWRVASVTFNSGDTVPVPTGAFNNDDELEPPPGRDVVYYLYPTVTPPYIIYFGNYSDAYAKNIPNRIADGNSYVVGTNIVVGGDITPYTNWQVATTESDPEFVITITTGVFANNFDMATLLAVGDPNTTVFYVYPASYIRYFDNYTTALSGNPNVEIARNPDSYIVGNTASGNIGTITKWRVALVDFNPSDPVVIPTGVFNNGDDMTALALPGSDAIFYLYPTITPPYIRYFDNYTDAAAAKAEDQIAAGDSYILGTNIVVGDIGSYTSWQVAVTQSDPEFVISPTPTGVFNNNDDMTTELVAGDPNTTVFYVYPSIPCFLEGTKILCQVDGVETYVPIEQIQLGTLVKTSKNGFKKVEIIGKKDIHNPGNDSRIKDRLYKCSPDAYPELQTDLFITGCHSILVDTLTDSQREKTTELLGKIFITEKKYRLMACIDERAVPWNSKGSYTVWHLALQHTTERFNYGVYAEGLLVETCSQCFLKKSNMELIE